METEIHIITFTMSKTTRQTKWRLLLTALGCVASLACALVPQRALGQESITVRGRVVDGSGQPVVGAAVLQEGTTNGTVTDVDGYYSLSVPSNATLQASFIGYENTAVPVAGQTQLNITMNDELQELEELVVIGYGTQRKVDLTGSVAIVDADEMKKVSNSNISTMLEGKVPGVRITTDGQPGADPLVRIRGIGSFGATNPLYVVDGVPMGTTIRDFSPNDIETIQVLKDASAAAIYGSRAANGVIIITTKSGKKNQPLAIDYSGYVGIDKIKKDVYDVMNAKEYGALINQECRADGKALFPAFDEGSESYIDDVDTDWFKECFKTGIRQNHNLNLSGGGENSTYNVALDFFDSDGTMEGVGPKYRRFTARVNNTMDIKFLHFKTGVVYSRSMQNNLNYTEGRQGFYGGQYPIMARALTLIPQMKAYDESTWCLDEMYPTAAGYHYDAYGYGTYNGATMGESMAVNLLMINNLQKYNCTVDRFVITGSVDLDFFDMVNHKMDNQKLDYNLNLSWSKTFAKDFNFMPSCFQSSYIYTADPYEKLDEGYRNYQDALIENTLTWDGKFGRNHINVVVGQTFEREDSHTLTGQGSDMTEPFYLQVQNSKSTTASSNQTKHTIASFIARLNYDFGERYLVSGTIRRDGSSRLSSDDRWGWFPSVSAGWRVDKESFWNVGPINLLKIRASYGVLGNENIGEYQYMASMNYDNYPYSFGNSKVTGTSISDFVNTAIAWEKKKTVDVGLDMNFLNNRLEFTFDWYKAKSEDLLLNVELPYSTGTVGPNSTDAIGPSPTMNAATMENSGLEFLVGWHSHARPIKYDVSVNLSTVKNEVTGLGAMGLPLSGSDCRTIVGEEVGRFYGYVYEGIFQDQNEIDQHALQSANTKPGDCKYADLNDDNIIDDQDQTFLGSGMPKLTFGLNASVEWKGLDLSVSCYGASKFKAEDYVDRMLHESYGLANRSTDLNDAWTADNKSASVPAVRYADNGNNNNRMCSRWLQNAAYFKLANIELGYNFAVLGNVKKYFPNVRLYVSAQNVATATKYKGYNVDFAGGTLNPGFNYCSYPTPRTIMFGLKFGFRYLAEK